MLILRRRGAGVIWYGVSGIRQTADQAALLKGHEQVALLLIEKCADVNVQGSGQI
jgi:hypothetical protein